MLPSGRLADAPGRALPARIPRLRAEKGGFLALVYDTDAAAEITLQPIRRFGFDGAILFSDILIVPLRDGAGSGIPGRGRAAPVAPLVDTALASLHAVPERLAPIYETVAKVKAGLGGSRRCWALPAARGPSPPTWWRARAAATSTRPAPWPIAIRQPFQAIIDAIVRVTVEYLSGQIGAAPKRCNCSTAGRAALPRPNSNAG
jgi:uroporphyrinogen decarboxylase